MSLHQIASYLAELLAGGSPRANERTIVVCAESDEPHVRRWANAVYGADGLVVPLARSDELKLKVNQAKSRPGKPATRVVVFLHRNTTDPKDGSIKIGGLQEDLTSTRLTVLGFRNLEFTGRICQLSVLLKIAKAWELKQVTGCTSRLFTASHPFNFKPQQPVKESDLLAAANNLLAAVHKHSSGNYGLDKFMAFPQQPELLAERLKGVKSPALVPFEWFGGPCLEFNPSNGNPNLGTPRLAVVPNDITYTIERTRLAQLLEQVDSAPNAPESKAILEKLCADDDRVVQRIVVTIT